MKNLMMMLMLVMGVLLVASIAAAADSTDTLGATITGNPVHTLAVLSGSSLSITDAGDVGSGAEQEFTGGPVRMEFTDNDYTVTGGESLFKAKISSELPDQYGSDKAYIVRTGNNIGVVAIGPDNSALGGVTGHTVDLTDEDQDIATVDSGTSFTDAIVHLTEDYPVYLVVNSGKVLRGDTNDDITITFTFPEY